jgi:hypothetical protein
MGDRTAAAREGQTLLQFLRTKPESEQNRFFIRRLEAEGQLFSGHPQLAIRSAKASLDLMPRSHDAVTWIGVAMMTAHIYAWAGATVQADDLLQQLATLTPGLAPARIARDPPSSPCRSPRIPTIRRCPVPSRRRWLRSTFTERSAGCASRIIRASRSAPSCRWSLLRVSVGAWRVSARASFFWPQLNLASRGCRSSAPVN